MRDPVNSYKATADIGGTTSGLTFPIFVHKVVVLGGSNNTGNIKINEGTEIVADVELINLTSAAAVFAQEDFSPPVRFQKGLSIDMTGSGAIAYVYYTRV